MKRLAVLTIILMATFVLVATKAQANPGSNYTQQYSTGWYTAGVPGCGAHQICLQFNPATDYWKMELRTQCPGDDLRDAWETVTWNMYKGSYGGVQTDWDHGWAQDQSTYYDGQVHDNDYPGGAGVQGYYTPNYNGSYIVEARTYPGDYGTWSPDTPPCQFKVAIEKHV